MSITQRFFCLSTDSRTTLHFASTFPIESMYSAAGDRNSMRPYSTSIERPLTICVECSPLFYTVQRDSDGTTRRRGLWTRALCLRERTVSGKAPFSHIEFFVVLLGSIDCLYGWLSLRLSAPHLFATRNEAEISHVPLSRGARVPCGTFPMEADNFPMQSQRRFHVPVRMGRLRCLPVHVYH